MGEIPSASLGSISLVCGGQSAVSRHLQCSWCSGIWWCCLRIVWCLMLFRLRCCWWRWETGWGRGHPPWDPRCHGHFCRGHAVQHYLLAMVCQEVLDPVLCRAFYSILTQLVEEVVVGHFVERLRKVRHYGIDLLTLGCVGVELLYKLDELGFTGQSFSESMLIGVQDAVPVKVLTNLADHDVFH